MAYIPSQKLDAGLFVPTTDIYELGILENIDPSSPQFKELIVRLSLAGHPHRPAVAVG